MEKEEKIEVSKKSDWNQWLAVVLLVLLVMNGMTWFTVASINEKEDCPDCNLECPDIPECPEMPTVECPETDLSQLYQMLESMEGNISTDLGWVDYWQHWMIYLIWEIKNDTLDINLGQIPQYPRDYITIINYTENTSLQIEYYNNLFGQNMTSPVFTIDNWTELMVWALDLGDARLYQNQRFFIMLVGINMAYYKETGTWLGE